MGKTLFMAKAFFMAGAEVDLMGNLSKRKVCGATIATGPDIQRISVETKVKDSGFVIGLDT